MARASSEQVVSIHEARIERRMFTFIQNFLKPRSFKVKVNEILYDTKVQTEDIPRGSVVSPTLLILKINKIVAQLPNDNRFKISLYKEDLLLFCHHPNLKINERKLQNNITIVGKIAQKIGFNLSTSFTNQSIPLPIELRFSNIRTQKTETVKNFGLVFDSKLDWKAHKKQLKCKCNKAVNLMRSVSLAV